LYKLSRGCTYIIIVAVTTTVIIIVIAVATATSEVKWGKVIFRINIKILYKEGA
jgi:hypothetical protein